MASQVNQKAKVTLHWLNKSRSQRILWLFEELKINYDVKIYHRQSNMLAPPELESVHPLGKSPVITVDSPAASKPFVIAESALIVEYLSEYFGKSIIPQRYVEGKEGQIGGETEEYLRYRYYMHYAEGSFMSLLLLDMILYNISAAPVPAEAKPVIDGVTGKIGEVFTQPNFRKHFNFLESQLATSGGDYICGKQFTGADVLMSFPFEMSIARNGLTKEKFPHIVAYVEKLHQRDAYKRAVEKITELDGKFDESMEFKTITK